jgi:hypothetical protein
MAMLISDKRKSGSYFFSFSLISSNRKQVIVNYASKQFDVLNRI